MKLKALLPFLAFLTIFAACSDKNEALPPIDPAFTNYIRGFTAGVISNKSTIKIKLAEANPKAVEGEEISGIFDFSPDIEGKAIWIDDKTVEFIPTERLPSGVIYDAEFELGDLQDVPSKLSTFEFRFQTIRQDIYLVFEGMQAYEDDKLQWQQLSGTIQTSDYTEIDALQKTLTATQNGKELSISWEFSSEGLSHVFKVDSVSRKEEAQKVVLAWNGQEIDSEAEGEQVIDIPALGDFTVMSVLVEQLPKQKITINFSDPLSSSQQIEGLIYTKEADEFRLRKERNSVFLYPTSDLSGDRKLVISKGIKNSLGYGLKELVEKTINFSSMKPQVEFVGTGNILPSSDGFKFPIRAVNLSAVNVKVIKIFEDNVAQFLQSNQLDGEREIKRVGRIIYKESISLVSEKNVNFGSWNTYQLDLSKMVAVEPGAIYRITVEFDQSQSLYPCDNSSEVDQKLYTITDSELSWYDTPSDYYWDYYEDYYEYDDGYRYQDRENPCSPSYFKKGNRSITTNVLASDIGLIAKSGDQNQMKVAITDLKTTNPISGATIELYNYQQQVIGTVQSDNDGFATVELKDKPFLLVAKRGAERGYLRVDDGSALSVSMFDVSGENNVKGVKGFIYGERGVWRPGDSLFLSFILEDKNSSLPVNHPVILELYTPESQLYTRIVKNKGLNGFYDLRTKTSDDAPTGNWQAKVKVGNSTFYKRVKIEAIKPNRLKINIDFERTILTKTNTRGKLSSKWLHGADADGLRAMVEMNLSGGSTSFKNYEEYQFDDPSKSFSTEEKVVFDGQLNSNGETVISPIIEVGKGAPGMLQANFKTRVFERGGDFSIDRFKTVYSPFESYVGVKIPEGKGWNKALYSNEANLIPIVTVGEDGKPVNRKNLKVEIFDINWRWWWERNEGDDIARYVSNRIKNLIKTETISTTDGKALYQMSFDQDRWGRKLIQITDPVSGHVTGGIFYLTYKGWWDNSGANNPGGAEMLNFTTDKENYTVGDDIVINLPEIKAGRVLVSIESGSKIISTFWKEASETKQGVSFKATADMAPNVYAHLTLIQPHANTGNDMPIRMYGVQNISVEAPNTHLNPVIKMPDELKPEQEVKLTISEKDGKAMTYTIAVVDDGLLDLTRFKTPNPWDHFYKREALGVKTWDLYQYVMGAYNGEISGLLALGGDDALNAGEGNKANRFEPVVRFLGPFELKKGDDNEHRFKMPNYVGSVRTMVIAGNNGAYGAAEKTTAVKKPLMVLATLPRVVCPAETLKLPVTVFSMDQNIKNVKVTVETNEFFSMTAKEKEVQFSKVGDQLVYFDLSVSEKIGVGKVKVTVSGNGQKATHEIEIGVRLPNPEINKTISAVVEPGKTWSTDYSPIGIKGTNKGAVEVSSIPPLNLEKRLGYLIRYPHGCIEQTTSAVFPQLYLNDLMKLTTDRKNEIQTNVTQALDKLRSFQLGSGGFAYWPGNMEVSSWGTSYAGHFMIEAKQKGYLLPTGLYTDWLRYQAQTANAWTPDHSQNRSIWQIRGNELEQAYRLYTLALAGKPAMGAMNRLKEQNNLQEATKWRLAAAYALANRKSVAEGLIASLSTTGEENQVSYTYGSQTRDQAMILESLHLIGNKIKGKQVMDEVANALSSETWMSTQTTAYSLLAIAKFVGAQGESQQMKYELIVNGDDSSIDSDQFIEKSSLPMKKGKVEIRNEGNRTLFVQLNLSGVPLNGVNVDSDSRLNMQVAYFNVDGTALNPSKIVQGTDFIVEVKVKHPGGADADYKEMAISQLFPSGWEIQNFRMDETTSSLMRDKPTYQDIRDDRVYTYFDLPKNGSKTFSVLLNAAYLGKFYLPAVECSVMYDNTIQSVKSGQWVEVVE